MKRFTPRPLIIAISFLAVFAISVASYAQSGADSNEKPKTAERTDVYHDLEIFTKILEKVSQNYVNEVDTHKLMKKAIDGMLSELDPHSQYLDGLDYEDLMVSTRGEFGGLGMLISFRDNFPTVMSPIDGTPAERAGIRGGDQIVEIEGQNTAGWTVDKAVGQLRGEPGTKIKFRIRHPNDTDNTSTEYVLVREVINVSSVPYHGMLKEGVGYIRVSNFAQKTAQEMETSLEELEGKGMRALVLDFRSNPGGLLQTATEVSELFLEKDKLLVYTKGRLANSNRKYYSANRSVHTGYPIIVMVNGASASASEIFAGAMQDWDAAFVVGQTSYGKGTVQTVFKLSDTEAVKLTTAKYYTPSGRSIHKAHQAVQADLEDDDDNEDDSLSPRPSPVDSTPRRTYSTVAGRKVYGGGGIVPDLAVVPDSLPSLTRRVETRSLTFRFSNRWVNQHPGLKLAPPNEAQWKAFVEFLGAEKVPATAAELQAERPLLERSIHREMARRLSGDPAAAKVALEGDPVFEQALDILTRARTAREVFKIAAASGNGTTTR